MNRSFTDILDEEERKNSGSLAKGIGIVAAVLVLSIVMINTTGCTQNNSTDTDIEINNPAAELPKEDVKVGNDGVNGAIAPDEVAAEQPLKDTTAMVAMSLEDTGRSDPFLPDHEKVVVKPKPKYDFELMPPPETITVDSTATDVISTKVSGIMFDNFNPSAILNIGGSDYLVRTGDVINNYKVLSIGKEHVTVQNGANVYKAGVGELFTGDGINYNTISNLESKFGGRKNTANK